MKNDNILEMNTKTRLTADITFLMLKGAGYAAIVVLAMWFFVAAFAAIGRALPEEARMAADPINRPAPAVQMVADPVADDPVVEDDAMDDAAPAIAD
ncbi:MAG: RC-LH1 core complex protein PufX [Loktanella sp.]|nr:RC-LH1 core complex protein PufX [Loktanella sp.]